MSEWYETLDGLHARAWETLRLGVCNQQHPARLPNFATVSPDGWPEARTVVLRSAEAASGEVSLHTDLFSGKVQSLRANPKASLHIWDSEQALQLRMKAEVSITSGADTRQLWDRIPDHAQQSYGVTPPPGARIDAALDYVKEPDPDTFAVLTCRISQIDVVHLGDDHRRALFSRASNWAGQWLSP
ncbi:pyridoxamine 5'-phosphate oxidase family protein [Yoonia maritima]|uniref:pyridoxamine 5'-phosphate oxidase family protein n=1 Tax=Yoonia maritima TaxID=1435347 RepID=UPI0037351C34